MSIKAARCSADARLRGCWVIRQRRAGGRRAAYVCLASPHLALCGANEEKGHSHGAQSVPAGHAESPICPGLFFRALLRNVGQAVKAELCGPSEYQPAVGFEEGGGGCVSGGWWLMKRNERFEDVFFPRVSRLGGALHLPNFQGSNPNAKAWEFIFFIPSF